MKKESLHRHRFAHVRRTNYTEEQLWNTGLQCSESNHVFPPDRVGWFKMILSTNEYAWNKSSIRPPFTGGFLEVQGTLLSTCKLLCSDFPQFQTAYSITTSNSQLKLQFWKLRISLQIPLLECKQSISLRKCSILDPSTLYETECCWNLRRAGIR
jgi:hypothetical protein